MADTTKAQKLASARKKFKELKKEKKKNSSQTPQNNEIINESAPISREQTPPTTTKNIPISTINNYEHQLPNYFSNAIYGDSIQQPAAFFDSISQPPPSTNPVNENNYFSNNYSSPTSNYFNKQPSPHSFNNSENNVLSSAFISDRTSELEPEVMSETHQEIINAVEETFITPENVETSQPIQETHVEKLAQPIVEGLHEFLNQTTSAQISSPNDSHFELINQQLQAQLAQEKSKSEQLSNALQEYQNKIVQLESEINSRETVFLQTGTTNELELSKMREDLRCHVQTVDILVAQKAELVATLSQLQLASKQKIEECEELQGRLKASRSRVADLEREVNSLKSDKLNNDSLGREHSSELEKLRAEFQALRDAKEEILQDSLEAREKLRSSTESNAQFQQQIAELSSQLSLANIKIQQLTTGSDAAESEPWRQEKEANEKRIAELTETVKALAKDRDESSIQYQQYVQQLNGQMSNLATRLEDLQKENESLAVQEQNRVKHIGELEKQLQHLKTDQVAFSSGKPAVGEFKAELESSQQLVEKLELENLQLHEENGKVLAAKDKVVKVLEAKNEAISRLESVIEELQGNQPDNAKLLAIMESDKVAAARAVSQNTELKLQMESMQEVFMKLNNDKVELTEKLGVEQKSNKDLIEKLQKTEIHLQTLATAIEVKDKELCNLRENSVELNKQVLQSEQLNDRLRHYEAHDHSSHCLQTELQEANLQITKLNDEIRKLKEDNMVQEVIGEKKNPVSELENKVKELEIANKTLQSKLDSEPAIDSNHNDNVLDKESAMKHLEEKFLRTMKEVAELTEEKQRLEYLVLQLQSETETIGEYVALYQHQRSILKQKALEKDQQLTQLADDREKIKGKLDMLNQLIKKLVLENGSVPSELLAQHEQIQAENAQELCEEHARIHSEINKMQQNGNSLSCDSEKSETAEKIIALLSEIKSSNLVQPTENFHHCPWCSGQLITV